MKKNRMMRLASGLLVAVLITTSTISGTFAKYTTADTASDEARVAKWGITVIAKDNDENDLFLENYTDAVSSVANEEIVAPGTSGTMTDIAVNGTPEVDFKATYTADLTLTGWTVDVDGDPATPDTEVYFPIVITVNGDEKAFTGTKQTELDAFISDVEAAIGGATKTYTAGQTIADTLDVSWKWDFSVNTDKDIRDTRLGDAAAAGNAATIKLEVNCLVEQTNTID
ncbi:MAG: hypothetical protein E7484_03770 [Ruminococcaceae bacterium]|nr:hypothetical protein [Oscillospiraceae bacterium]